MRPLLLVLAALSPALPAAALACSCLAPGETFLLEPADGTANLPTNTRIWVGASATRGVNEGEEQLPIEVFDAAGDPVPGTEGRLVSNFDVIDVFTPLDELAPDSRYTVVVGDVEQMSFVTGSAPDLEAPPIPEEIERSGWSRPAGPFNVNSCSTGTASHGINLLFAMEDGLLLMVDADGRAELDAEAMQGVFPAMSTFGSVSLGRGFGCGGDNWEEAKFKAQTQVRWSSFDRAGNWSGWSEEETAVVSKDGHGGGGCNAAGRGPGAVGLASVGLWLLAASGRRRARR